MSRLYLLLTLLILMNVVVASSAMPPTSMPSEHSPIIMHSSYAPTIQPSCNEPTKLLSSSQTCFVSTFSCHNSKHTCTNNFSAALASKKRNTNCILIKRNNARGRTSLVLKEGEDVDLIVDPNQGGNDNNDDQRLIIPLIMYGLVPFIPSAVLSAFNDQYLYTKGQFNIAAASLTPNMPTDSAEYMASQGMYDDTMQQLFVLLLSKRLALYFLGTCLTVYAGWKAAMGIETIRKGTYSGPGDYLDKLSDEVLGKIDSSKKEDEDKRDEDQLFATLVDGNASSVGTSLAIGLPLVLGASLATSYILTISRNAVETSGGGGAIQDVMSSPYISTLPTAILCLLFMAAEFRWALPSNDQANSNESPLLSAGNFLALLYVLGAYAAKSYPTISINGIDADIWPLQNGVNIALAVGVARAISPFLVPTTAGKSIRTVALALTGLTMFDAISTFGTVANAADTITATAQSSMSVMETVARDKLSSWQPGLLEIILGHGTNRVSEALGLGDVVFPSILVSWGFVADNDNKESSGGYTYASAAIVGYLFGSLATEIVGSFHLLGDRGGLPALVFLIPSMLFAVTLAAWSRDELNEVWGSVATSDDT